MVAIASLSAARALIFRIVHRDNVPWILRHGVHCRSSDAVDPGYVGIGNPELIEKRKSRDVPVPPGGNLSDYVPFYFTPRSPMLRNIRSGRRDVPKRSNAEIVVLVSSLHRLRDMGRSFIFTDRHAYAQTAGFFGDLAELAMIDWAIIQKSDFQRDTENLPKMERYQAEALVQRHMPVDCLLGLACDTEAGVVRLQAQLQGAGVDKPVAARPGYYFQ